MREGIENIPVTDHVMEDEDIIFRDDPDDPGSSKTGASDYSLLRCIKKVSIQRFFAVKVVSLEVLPGQLL